jgi:hypothetical protein
MAMWSGKPDPQNAPRCCGGEYMLAYSVDEKSMIIYLQE